MKERPILFSGPMVRAILDGRKTQTRRPVKFCWTGTDMDPMHRCPLGQPGDRLWVRETWMMGTLLGMHRGQERPIAIYRADGHPIADGLWRPSIHMPRWASRITLEITGVRVERVQDITEEDAMKEGCIRELKPDGSVGWGAGLVEARDAFRDLWQSIYGTWEANPFVWAVEFRRTK